MTYKSKIFFYVPLIVILIMMYARSWLPGGSFVESKEVYIGSFMGFMVMLFAFDFIGFFNLEISFSSFEKKILFFLFLLVLISSSLFNSDEIFKLKYLLRLLCFGIFVLVYFFILPRFILDNPKYFEVLIKLIANFGFLAATLGISMLFLGFNPVSKHAYALLSLINHPNNSSMIFTITFIPTLYYIYWKGSTMTAFSKSFYIFSFIVQILAQLFTYTRAGMIAASVGLLVFFILYYRSRFLIILPFLFSIIPVLVVGFFKVKGFASFVSRFYLLIPAYQMITESKTKLLWGYGVSNSLVEYKKNLAIFNPSDFLIDDPHNTYVTLILMLGVIFTLILLFFLGLLLARCLKHAIVSNMKDERLYFIFLLSSALSILVQGLFDTELVKVEYFSIQYLLTIFGLMYLMLKYLAYKKDKTQLSRLLY